MTVKSDYYLVRIVDGEEKDYYKLKDGLNKIGRSCTQDIRCRSTQVSREHCVLLKTDSQILLMDRNSSNGTFLREGRIQPLRAVLISEEDIIGLGADPNSPAPDYIYKLKVENPVISEAQALLVSLKRKELEEPLTHSSAKKLKNENEIDCIIIDEPVIDGADKTLIKPKQQAENNKIVIVKSDSEEIIWENEVQCLEKEEFIKNKKDSEKMEPEIVDLDEDEHLECSFSLRDEVIIIDSDEDELSSSQLFSYSNENAFKKSEQEVKIKVENENYEVHLDDDENDEDHASENNDSSFFQDYYIHCSQEIVLNESSKKINSNSKTLEPTSSKNDILPDKDDVPEVTADSSIFQDHFIHRSHVMVQNESSKTINSNLKTLEPTSSKNDTLPDKDDYVISSSATKKKIPFSEQCKMQVITECCVNTELKESIDKIKSIESCDKVESKENRNSCSDPSIEFPSNQENQKKQLLEKKSSNKKSSNIKPQEMSNLVSKKLQEKPIEKKKKIKEVDRNIEKNSSNNFDFKFSTPLITDNKINKKSDVKKTKSTNKSPKEVKEVKKKVIKRKDKEMNNKISRRSDVEKLKKERAEKLKMIALKSKSKSELKTIILLENTIEKNKKSENTNDCKPVLDDTVKVPRRSKSISFLNDSKPKNNSRSKLKGSNNKINKKTMTSKENNTLKSKILADEGRNKNNANANIESVAECRARLKLQKESPPPARKTVRFKEKDLVQIRIFECEGKLVRKVSDKGIRTRRDVPPEAPLRNYSRNTLMKFNYVLHDICKWNVSWLEERIMIDKDPPVVRMPFLNVKDRYVSYRDYWATMYPLLMVELWCEIFENFVLQNMGSLPGRTFHGVVRNVTKNPSFTGVCDNDVRKIVSVDCVFVGNRKDFDRGLAPDEGDLGIMQVVIPGQSKRMYRTFTFVSALNQLVPYRNSDKFAQFAVINVQNQLKITFDRTFCLYAQLSFCDSPNKPINEGDLLTIRILRNINRNLRVFDSLNRISVSPLLNHVLDPKCIVKPQYHHKISKQIVSNFPMNQSQIDIILEVTNNLLCGKSPISVIHGPPGTGKTHVIANLVLQLCSHLYYKRNKNPAKEKILLCSPSNAAIDSLVLKLLDIRQSLPNDKRFKLIRVGPPDIIHRQVNEIASHTLAAKEVGHSLDADNIKLDLKLLTAHEMSISNTIEYVKTEKTKNNYTFELSLIQKRKNNLEKFLNNEDGSHSASQIRSKLIRETEMKVIQGAEIIATTLSSCYTRKIIEAIEASQGFKFSYCIVDEATQGKELEVLLPLLHNVIGLVLVGDPMQLAPTVKSKTGKQCNLGRSVFHRMFRAWESEGNVECRPFYKLNVQHRMHPEIAMFPSQEFYKGNLITPDFLNLQLPFAPYTVLNHSYEQDPDGESNRKESELVAKLLSDLNKAPDFRDLTIGVIVPYQRQKQIMQESIKNLKENIKYLLHTVDSYQGQEKDVIILSCVRTEGVGFLSDRLRINVALTRARKCLIVTGNFQSLQGEDTWRSLLEDARNRGVMRTVDDKSLSGNLVDLLKPRQKKWSSKGNNILNE